MCWHVCQIRTSSGAPAELHLAGIKVRSDHAGHKIKVILWPWQSTKNSVRLPDSPMWWSGGLPGTGKRLT